MATPEEKSTQSTPSQAEGGRDSGDQVAGAQSNPAAPSDGESPERETPSQAEGSRAIDQASDGDVAQNPEAPNISGDRS
ncbi:MAG: hypothetical protein H0T73_11995 [Ardenticatenales bacterium]|nr:hypothetical protein [Ardenticatenales bacterium]